MEENRAQITACPSLRSNSYCTAAYSQRQPLTKEERAEAEKILAAAVASGDGVSAAGVATKEVDPLQQEGGAGVGSIDDVGPDLIDPVDFFKEFDSWVDGKYPGDRGSATKVKVAFRKVRESLHVFVAVYFACCV